LDSLNQGIGVIGGEVVSDTKGMRAGAESLDRGTRKRSPHR